MYLYDYKVGMEFEMDPISFSREEIVDFSKKYDPRPFHIDEEEGKKSPNKDIIAPGMMVLLRCWAVWVHSKIDEKGIIAGIGMDNVQFLRPVYANMDLYGKVKITGVDPSRNGKTGAVTFQLKVTDKENVEIMHLSTNALVAVSEEFS